jgi:hypothetical protein
MALRFGDMPSVENKVPEAIVQSGIKVIKNRRDRELCDKLPAGTPEDIPVAAAVLPQVQAQVLQLFQRQMNHAAECGRLFQRLFNIQRDPQTSAVQISLSVGLIRGGFAELNRINHMARMVLVKYYEDCETLYLQGMKTVIDARIIAATPKPLGVQMPQPIQPPQGTPNQPSQGPPVAAPTTAPTAPMFTGQRMVPGAPTVANAAARVGQMREAQQIAQREAIAQAANVQLQAARDLKSRNLQSEEQAAIAQRSREALARQGLNTGAIMGNQRVLRSSMKKVQFPPPL